MHLDLTLLFTRFLKLIRNLRNWRELMSGRDRQQWDQAAIWYRLRYEDRVQAQTMLDRLSHASGRVALRLRVDGSVQCWIGVHPQYAPILLKMAPSFDCIAEEKEPPSSWGQTFNSANAVSETHSSDAYIVDGHLFATITNDNNGSLFPQSIPGNESPSTVWRMPEPVLGLSTRSSLDIPAPPPVRRNNGQWLFGWDSLGYPVGDHQAGLVGEPEAVTRWLSAFMLSVWKEKREPIALIDGTGEWIDDFVKLPQVHSLVTSRLMRVMDIQTGEYAFNPLDYSQSNDLKIVAKRWLWWLRGFGLPEKTLKPLILSALQEGVKDLPGFYQWLLPRRTSSPEAVMPLQSYIEQLDREPQIREWILAKNRFTDPRMLVRQTPLLITPRLNAEDKWSRLQAVRGLVGILLETNTSVVLHGIKLDKSDRRILQRNNRKLLVTNAPGATTIITRCAIPMAQQLRARLDLPPEIADEHIKLLPFGASIVVRKTGELATASWRNHVPS
ncbi:MAG: hypothetical protein GY803_10280 [Chloroflexi bacterium]|nr:hypothetical protein [Chloroflexota bacterium]